MSIQKNKKKKKNKKKRACFAVETGVCSIVFLLSYEKQFRQTSQKCRRSILGFFFRENDSIAMLGYRRGKTAARTCNLVETRQPGIQSFSIYSPVKLHPLRSYFYGEFKAISIRHSNRFPTLPIFVFYRNENLLFYL